MLQKTAMLVLMMAVSVFAVGQHKTSSAPKSAPAPKAPAQHSAPKASAPSHSSAPSGQHGSPSGGQHSNTAGGQHSNTAGGQHSSTAGGQHSSNSNGQHGTANGQHGNTANGQHGTTANGQHGNNNAGGQHNNNAGGQHGAAANNRGGNNNQNGRGQNGKGGANNTNAKGGAGGNRGGHTPPGRQVSLKGGGSAHIRPNGQVRSVNRNGMHIERGVHGQRRIVSNRNGVRVVSGRRGGYVQRAYVTRGGRSYYSRTYYYHGGYRTGVYRGYYYGGHPYYGYYPAYYYRPAYYGWAYNPWPAPVAYGWGWGGSPWYGYYGAYYAPYPVYPSAAFWLADFVVAASLQAAYEAQAEGELLEPSTGYGTLVASLGPVPAADPGQTKLSPEVKQKISDELKLMMTAEQAEAEKGKGSSGGAAPAESKEAPPALDPKIDTFLVSTDLTLVADGDECDLSEGDVITRTTTTPDDDQNVNVKVVASKKNDCAIGKEGPVALDDMQELYNHLREQLKDGMGELAKKQGTGGLPKAPDTTTTDGDVPAPPPDKTVEKTLEQTQADADKTESDVKQESGSGGGSN
jgi:hypothetical protein